MKIPENLNYPKQRLSLREKLANDTQWGKDVMDTLALNYVTDWRSDGTSSRFLKKLSNYQLFNNILNQKDFELDRNPMGIDVGQFQDEIQPYNKSYNKIQVLCGEEYNRPLNYRTVLQNADGIKSKLVERDYALRTLIEENVGRFITKLQEILRISRGAMDPKQKRELEQELQYHIEQSIPSEEFEKLKSTTYLSARERLANQILDYLVLHLSLKDKMNDAFKHGLISGEEVVWVGIENGQPTAKPLNSLGVFYHKSPETKYIQDGLYAGFAQLLSGADVLDMLGEKLTEEQIKKIEEVSLGKGEFRDDLIGPKMQYAHTDIYDVYQERIAKSGTNYGSYGASSNYDDWLVIHVEWVSQKKVYFIEFTNEYGDLEKMIADENFVIPEYATKSIEKNPFGVKKTVYSFDGMTATQAWIPEVWEGYRVGSDIYCGIRPKPYQSRSIDNPYSVKLGYHGIVYSAMNSEPVSLMDRMKPFQYLYFIVVHKLKKLIARDKGKLFSLDVSMVPEEMGLEKTLYYLDEMDLDIFNPLQNAESPGAYQRGKVKGSIDRSNTQHILNYISLMDAIDQQISDVAGITRQREGQVKATEAVTNAMANIQQSSVITEAAYFQPHFKLWESVLSSLVQVTQACWKEKSIVKQYVLDDLSIATLELTPGSLDNSDFGVYITNSMKENDVFNTLKQLAQPLIQNDKAKMSDIIKIFKATSAEQIAKQIQDSEEQAMAQQQQEMQQAQQMQQQQLEAQQRQLEDQQLHEKELELLKGEIQIKLAQIKNQDPYKMDELEQELKIAEDKLKVEEKKIASQEKIAKMKPSPSKSN